VEGVGGWHDIARHPEGRRIPGLVLFRWDAPLFFANAQAFHEQVRRAVATAPTPTRWVVVAAEPVTDVDITAADALLALDTELHEAGADQFFVEMKGGEWFAPAAWKSLDAALPAILRQLLAPLKRLLAALQAELTALTQQVEAAVPAGLPVGLGRLCSQLLEREIGDWQRFHNRRQVGSYTGTCPREDSSGVRPQQGPINKHGNPRVRATLIELTWRLLKFQPTYRPVAKWQPVLANH
jgi:transposase